MSDRFFLDTNVLVYSFDQSSPNKAEEADRLISEGLESGKGVISYQVVQEFFSVAFRRFPEPMRLGHAEQFFSAVLRPLWVVQSSPALCLSALRILDRFQLHWYDALIVAAASAANCGILYSEDLQNGQRFDDLEVRNPFLRTRMR
jgi:predicted nucleic acid-binding protein